MAMTFNNKNNNKNNNNNNNNSNMIDLSEFEYKNWGKKGKDKQEKKKDSKKVKMKMGLKIANLNVRGLTSMEKKNDLHLWLIRNDIDIITIQEWYVHHELEDREFDTLGITEYEVVQASTNSKTLIMIKKNLEFIDLSEINSENTGLDMTWMALKNEKNVLAIGSIYDNPFSGKTKEVSKNELTKQMKKIRILLKEKNTIFLLGGDINGKHVEWGSSKTDERGIDYMDWSIESNMSVINDGTKTYRNATTGKEDVLDVQMISTRNGNIIESWEVNKDLHNINYNNGSYRNYMIKSGGKNPPRKIKYINHKPFSDHYCMIVRLNFNPNYRQFVDTIIWNFDEKLIWKYQCKLEYYMNGWRKYFRKHNKNKQNMEKLVKLFQMVINQGIDNLAL